MKDCDHLKGNLQFVYYPMTNEQTKELEDIRITSVNLSMRCNDCGMEFNNPYWYFHKMKMKMIQELKDIITGEDQLKGPMSYHEEQKTKLERLLMRLEIMEREAPSKN